MLALMACDFGKAVANPFREVGGLEVVGGELSESLLVEGSLEVLKGEGDCG